MKCLYIIAFLSFFAAGNAQLLPTLPFPWPFCASTTTVTLGGTYTLTRTSTVTSATSTVTVTAPPSLSITTTRTTTYSPTEVTCLSTATTFSPYRAPFGTLAARAPAPQITLPPIIPTACPTVPTITVIPPTVSNEPCTRVEGDYALVTSTVTSTTTGISTTTTTPIATQILTETWIQPTPTSYNGLNYYQYLNGYNYNTDGTGLGGGGFSTSDWNANYSYYTSGLARDINFESPNWPTGPAICQLPGQPSESDCSQWTVVFQGFLFARSAGGYEVYSPIASETDIWQDNAGFWWGGEKAYSDYQDGNVDGAATPLGIEGVTNRYEYNLTDGEFMPFTFIFANGQGPAANRVTVTTEDGRVYPADLDIFVPPCEDSAFVP
ncbi:GLEYA domain-containing protein [Aspergillus undulatus]|uniref:GLEYA domain-containing protein n=1 Tax=Aspergillus undulatus TaxID=1810928 RepID=UPI003CCD8B23